MYNSLPEVQLVSSSAATSSQSFSPSQTQSSGIDRTWPSAAGALQLYRPTQPPSVHGQQDRTHAMMPLTVPSRPSRCIHSYTTSAIDSQQQSLAVNRTRHVCRFAVRCCQHQTVRCRRLCRSRRRSVCRGDIFYVQSLKQSSRGMHPYFWTNHDLHRT